MGLKEYIARRVVYSVILIFAVLTVNFLIFTMLPGDPMRMYVSSLRGKIDQERYNALKAHFGLDKPLHERFVSYVFNMLTWDFGSSYGAGGVPVAEQVMRSLPNTIILMGAAAVLSMIAGILLGVIAAHKRGGFLDTGMVTGSLITYSVPIYFIGWLMIFFFVIQLRWLPFGGCPLKGIQGFTPTNLLEDITGRLSTLVLPTITLFLFTVGGWILLTRACVLETITEDYVVTARAKGLKERTVLYKHILKNASLPLITSVALSFGFLISGAIITETIFSYDGMGLLIWHALHPPDLPILQAVFYVIALCVIVSNFMADLLYGVIDPRIKYG